MDDMNERVRLMVLLPATRRRYEFRMPYDITVEQGARLMSRILAAREPLRYEASDEVDLMLLEGSDVGALINPKDSFRGLVLSGAIVEGSAVMLA